MNTCISYRYRDAGNNKIFGSAIIADVIDEHEHDLIRSVLASCPDDGFIPMRVGLPALREGFNDEEDFDLDHPWHEWEGIESTNEPPTVAINAKELLAAFFQVKAEGWDALDAELLKREALHV